MLPSLTGYPDVIGDPPLTSRPKDVIGQPVSRRREYEPVGDPPFTGNRGTDSKRRAYTGGGKDFDERTGRYRSDKERAYTGGGKDFDERTGRYRSRHKPGTKDYREHLRRMKEERMRRRGK